PAGVCHRWSGGAGGCYLWRLREHSTILLFLSLRLAVLVAIIAGLISRLHDSPAHRWPLGLSDASFPGSGLPGPAIDAPALCAGAFWTAPTLPLGATGGSGGRQSLVRAAWLSKFR